MMEAPLKPPEKYKRCKFRACSFKTSSQFQKYPLMGLGFTLTNYKPHFFNTINDRGVAPQATSKKHWKH